MLNPLVLNSILNKALQYSLHGDTQLASNLSFALKYLPEMFKPNAPDALSCLELRYKVRRRGAGWNTAVMPWFSCTMVKEYVNKNGVSKNGVK